MTPLVLTPFMLGIVSSEVLWWCLTGTQGAFTHFLLSVLCASH